MLPLDAVLPSASQLGKSCSKELGRARLLLLFCRECVATQGPLTVCPLLPLSSDHAAPHQRQLAAHTGVHRHQQDVVPLPRRATGHCAPAQPRHRHGRGSARWEALHGGPGGLGAGVSGSCPLHLRYSPCVHLPFSLGAGPCLSLLHTVSST